MTCIQKDPDTLMSYVSVKFYCGSLLCTIYDLFLFHLRYLWWQCIWQDYGV